MKLLLKKKSDGIEMLDTHSTIFQDVVSRANSIQGMCTDYIASGSDFSDIYLRSGCKFHASTVIEREKDVLQRSFYRNAFSQLCSKIEVPVGYINSCLKRDNSWLAEKNIISWLNGKYCDTDFLVREHGDSIRAVLSPSYICFDTPEILSAVSKHVSGMEIKGHLLTPERLHLRFISDKPLIEGDDLYSGIEIDSSDTGRARISIQYFIFKQVCTNGLMFPFAHFVFFQQRHISRNMDFSLRSVFVANLKKLPEMEVQARSIISASRKSRTGNLDNIQGMLASALNSGTAAKGIIKLFNDRVKGNNGFQYENNMFGVANAITEFAQGYTLDRRIELEKYAGRMLLSAA